MAFRSSVLPAADRLVMGVVTELPVTDPVGVDVVVDEGAPFCFAACLAAFSARRFCLDADWGAISTVCGGGSGPMGKLVIAEVRVEPRIDLGKLLRQLPVGAGATSEVTHPEGSTARKETARPAQTTSVLYR